jgi:hypothetical protein
VSKLVSFPMVLALVVCGIGCGGGSKSSGESGTLVPGISVQVISPKGAGALDFWVPDGSGAFGGNTNMVTNGSKFFYIDISPLDGHPAVVVGHKQQ